MSFALLEVRGLNDRIGAETVNCTSIGERLQPLQIGHSRISTKRQLCVDPRASTTMGESNRSGDLLIYRYLFDLKSLRI